MVSKDIVDEWRRRGRRDPRTSGSTGTEDVDGTRAGLAGGDDETCRGIPASEFILPTSRDQIFRTRVLTRQGICSSARVTSA